MGRLCAAYPIRQWTGDKPVDELTLYVYCKTGMKTSHLYEDAGEGYAYFKNDFSLKIFETEGKNGDFTFRQRKDAAYEPAYDKVKIYLAGFPAFVIHCETDGADMPFKEIRLRNRSLHTLTGTPDFERIKRKG